MQIQRKYIEDMILVGVFEIFFKLAWDTVGGARVGGLTSGVAKDRGLKFSVFACIADAPEGNSLEGTGWAR
jgi:hypothetical protein